jgi:hypothetical protein
MENFESEELITQTEGVIEHEEEIILVEVEE